MPLTDFSFSVERQRSHNDCSHYALTHAIKILGGAVPVSDIAGSNPIPQTSAGAKVPELNTMLTRANKNYAVHELSPVGTVLPVRDALVSGANALILMLEARYIRSGETDQQRDARRPDGYHIVAARTKTDSTGTQILQILDSNSDSRCHEIALAASAQSDPVVYNSTATTASGKTTQSYAMKVKGCYALAASQSPGVPDNNNLSPEAWTAASAQMVAQQNNSSCCCVIM